MKQLTIRVMFDLRSTADDREIAARVDDAEGQPSVEHVEEELAAEAVPPALKKRGTSRSSRPSRCQRIRCLRSATLATSEPAIWFCAQHWASAAESRD